MNRLDRLIIRELVGPWIFGVGIFTALIFTSVFLVRVTDWITRGVSVEVVFQLVVLLLPGMLVKTFSMALLLATLLSFGRLSNDSEIVAIRAAGASLFRVMRPVMLFGLVVAAAAFMINDWVVPRFSLSAANVQQDIKQNLDASKIGQPVFNVIYDEGKAVGFMGALDLNVSENLLTDVHIVTFDKDGKPSYVLFAKELEYIGVRDWRIRGGGRVISIYGTDVLDITGEAWPGNVAKPTASPRNLFAGILDDADALTMSELATEVAALKNEPGADPRRVRNLEFGYYNKIGLPLSVVIFGMLGAPLGIRSHRSGVASGFALSIALSFAYLIVANFMAVYAKAGKIPPYAASFAPVVLGFVAACVLIYRKNQ
jgi:lipopolysaccharide export system permease protein